MNTKYLPSLVILISILLTGCSAITTPRQIAAYPLNPPGVPSIVTLAYTVYLEIVVADTNTAAEQAIQIAYSFGGYLSDSQSWDREDGKYIILVLAVPSNNYSNMRRTLLSLGTLINEQTSDILINPDIEYGSIPFSTITLQLRPMRLIHPSYHSSGWNLPFTYGQVIGGLVCLVSLLVIGMIGILGLWALFQRMHR